MYELRAADWDAFTKVYDALEAIDEKMSIPLRRFNQAYGRQSGEDTIIDLTIALESSLLPNTREELQYRLSMRGAALLTSLRDPLETQALLKTMYDFRARFNSTSGSGHGRRFTLLRWLRCKPWPTIFSSASTATTRPSSQNRSLLLSFTTNAPIAASDSIACSPFLGGQPRPARRLG